MFPWDDVMPAADLAAFRRPPEAMDAPPIAGKRPALIIVDMTRMFVNEAYPSGCPNTRGTVEANRVLLKSARARKIPVFFTKSYADPLHEPTSAERGLWKHGPLGVEGLPPGDVIVEELAPLADETIVTKGSKPSAFFGTSLMAMLTALRVDTAIVTGISTSGCVRATAVDSCQSGFRPVVVREAVGDRSQAAHDQSLFDLDAKYADVMGLDDVLAYLETVGHNSER